MRSRIEAATPDNKRQVAVDVWVLDLDEPHSMLESFAEILSAAEQTRVAALIQEPHGRRYANSRVQLRHILASYLDNQPRDVRFGTGAHGKPALVADASVRLRFNNSRSAGTGLVAIQQDGVEVGVDVELIRRESDLAAVAERFFPRRDLAQIAALPPGQRTRARYDCWTRIEAELKGVGTGLAPRGRPLKGVNGDSEEAPIRGTGRRSDWLVANLCIAPKFSAALAAHVGAHDAVRTTVRSWSASGGP